MHTAKITTYFLLVALVGLSSGCGWSPRLSFPSPHNGFRLEVASPRLLQNSDLRIDLVEGNGSHYTLYRAGREMPVEFAYTYWSPDGDQLAFLGCSGDSVV